MARTQTTPAIRSSDVPRQIWRRKNKSNRPQETHDLFARGCSRGRVLSPGGTGEVDRGLKQGKEAIVAILSDELFGGKLSGRTTVRMASARAIDASTIVRIDKAAMIQSSDESTFSELFMAYLLSQRSHRGRPRRSALQFQREAARGLLLLAHLGRRASQNQSSRRLARKHWPRWSAPRGHA